jgi:small-conductance mechanosensitive channel
MSIALAGQLGAGALRRHSGVLENDMSDISMALADLNELISRPLFTLGSTDISLGRILLALGLILATIWLSRFGERCLQRLAALRPQPFSAASAYAFGRIGRYLLMAIGVVVALTTAGLNISTLAVIGGGLGIGFGFGFGLQTLVANFVSGIVLLLGRSLKVGDFVDLQSGVRGCVVEIAMRYTRVSTNDFVDVLVPNSEFVNGRVTNWTFDDTNRRIHIPFVVAYGTDKPLVRAAGLVAASRIDGIIVTEDRRAPEVWLVALGDSSLHFELVIWVTHRLASAPGRTNATVLWALENELRTRSIEMPFPQRDLHIRSGELRVQLASDRPSGTTS